MQRVLVAGASGALGREVVRALKDRGAWVRALSRSAARAKTLDADEVAIGDAVKDASLAGACDGADTVFSCLGQSVGTDFSNRAPGYHAVDYVGNRNLLDAARAARVRRFVYVSVFGAERLPGVAYMRAHADVADAVRASGLEHAIIQPTGFFSAYAAFFAMARSGRAVVFGDGRARTNAIHDADLAQVCASAIAGDERGDIPAGGPDVHTRREVVELAFAALGKKPRITRLPGWAPGAMGRVARPIAPRIGELLAFLGAVSAGDFVAPTRGTRRLADYYRELARGA
jgi:uncharacterized protein YbjT (DUF2867 family)